MSDLVQERKAEKKRVREDGTPLHVFQLFFGKEKKGINTGIYWYPQKKSTKRKGQTERNDVM